MNLDLTPDQESFAREAREWLAEHVPSTPLPSMDTADGFVAHRAWEAELASGRWSVVAWPDEFGGRGTGIVEWVLFEEEYYRAGAPTRVAQNGISLLAPIIFEHGTPDQRERFLADMADGTTIWAQAWSEPGAGSDLAAIRSTARRDDVRGGWVLNGQKIWSSRAVWADRGFGLFRSDPDAERHRGLTYFLFPLDAEGITVRPIAQLDGGTGFAEIFFDDVFVPDEDVLGAVGDGWRVAMSTAGNERGLSLRAPGRFLAAAGRLVDLWRRTAGDADDPGAQDAVVDAWIGAEAYRLFTWNTVSRLLEGDEVGAEGSINKLFWSELDLHIQETGLRLLGADAEVRSGDGVDGGRWVDDYLFALAGPIYAGTNEIQRDIVAERILGLPRGDQAEVVMRFLLTDEQSALAEAIDEIIASHGGVDIPQSWASGDTGPGLGLWAQFTELGLGGLRIPEQDGGIGGTAADLVVVFERLGYHGIPGPYLETIALLPRLVDASTRTLLAGGAMATASAGFLAPYAVDADSATLRFVIDADGIAPGEPGDTVESMSPLRRLTHLQPGARVAVDDEVVTEALDEAALAAAAYLIGAGERLLDEAVGYAKIREQFGRPIGEYQALKHHLADVRVGLSFARPLVHAAALTFGGDTRSRDVSAAKVAAGNAARVAARTSLQVHGAIGYTAEHHVGLWVTLVPALTSVWGTPAFHRKRVAHAIASA